MTRRTALAVAAVAAVVLAAALVLPTTSRVPPLGEPIRIGPEAGASPLPAPARRPEGRREAATGGDPGPTLARPPATAPPPPAPAPVVPAPVAPAPVGPPAGDDDVEELAEDDDGDDAFEAEDADDDADDD